VRVLLDEQLPRHLAWQLVGQDVYTVQQQEWVGLPDRELLTQAEAAGFDVLLTADDSSDEQEDVTESGIRIVLLGGVTSTLEDLLPIVPQVLAAIDTARPGQVVRIPKREYGEVCDFSNLEGRGSIRCDGTGDLVVVQALQIRDKPALAVGDRVEFTRVEMPEGSYAWDVVKVLTDRLS
jgi:cold shock CspA family protein